jgi:hypothetical protein
VQACLELSAEEYFGNLLKVEFKEKTSQQHLVAATRQLVARKLTQHRWQRQQAWQKVLSTYLGYLGSTVIAGTPVRRVATTSWCLCRGWLAVPVLYPVIFMANHLSSIQDKRFKVSRSVLQSFMHCPGFSFSNVVFSLNFGFLHILYHISESS